MAKAKRFIYETLLVCDLGYLGPDQRRERWEGSGRNLRQPQRVLHSIRCYPSKGLDSRGNPFPPDYISTDRPLARQYTEAVAKKVSRPGNPSLLDPDGKARVMRPKVSKIKFRLLEPSEITAEIERNAYDFGADWHPSMFEDATADVVLPRQEWEPELQEAKA